MPGLRIFIILYPFYSFKDETRDLRAELRVLAAPAPIPGTPGGMNSNTPKRAFSLDSPSSVLPTSRVDIINNQSGALRTPDNERITTNGTSHMNYFNRKKVLESIGKLNANSACNLWVKYSCWLLHCVIT